MTGQDPREDRARTAPRWAWSRWWSPRPRCPAAFVAVTVTAYVVPAVQPGEGGGRAGGVTVAVVCVGAARVRQGDGVARDRVGGRRRRPGDVDRVEAGRRRVRFATGAACGWAPSGQSGGGGGCHRRRSPPVVTEPTDAGRAPLAVVGLDEAPRRPARARGPGSGRWWRRFARRSPGRGKLPPTTRDAVLGDGRLVGRLLRCRPAHLDGRVGRRCERRLGRADRGLRARSRGAAGEAGPADLAELELRGTEGEVVGAVRHPAQGDVLAAGDEVEVGGLVDAEDGLELRRPRRCRPPRTGRAPRWGARGR